MPVLNVKIQDAAFSRFTRSPAHQALAELIWNALDADADKVEVEFIETDGSAGLSEIKVTDNGEGISHRDLHEGFENLGTSWKKHATETRTQGRVLHGKEGQGRYKVYALGQKATWETKVRVGTNIEAYSIHGESSKPQRFEYTNPVIVKAGRRTGTKLTIREIHSNAKSLKRQSASEEIHKTFALYRRPCRSQDQGTHPRKNEAGRN
jgi:DNA topoisomerase VI subunit B